MAHLRISRNRCGAVATTLMRSIDVAQMAPMKMAWVVAIAVPVAGIDAIVIAVTRRGQKAVTATHNDIFDIFGRISMLLRIRKNAAVAVAGSVAAGFGGH